MLVLRIRLQLVVKQMNDALSCYDILGNIYNILSRILLTKCVWEEKRLELSIAICACVDSWYC